MATKTPAEIASLPPAVDTAVWAALTLILAQDGTSSLDPIPTPAGCSAVVVVIPWAVVFVTSQHAQIHQSGRRNWLFLCSRALPSGAQALSHAPRTKGRLVSESSTLPALGPCSAVN